MNQEPYTDTTTGPAIEVEGDRITLKHCIQAFAVPGQSNLIDLIHPRTGLSIHSRENLAQVRLRHPAAEIVNVEEWCAAKARAQDTPVTWAEVTEEKFWDMLEVLPPAVMQGGAFLVGEPWDHHAVSGQPRFSAYIKKGEKHYTASRPMQVLEFLEFLRLGAAV